MKEEEYPEKRRVLNSFILPRIITGYQGYRSHHERRIGCSSLR